MIHNSTDGYGRSKTTHIVNDRNAKHMALPWWTILFNTTAGEAAAECASTGIPFHHAKRIIENLARDPKAMEAYKAFMQKSSCQFMEGYVSSKGASHE